MVAIRRMKPQDVEEVYNLGISETRFRVGSEEQAGFWTKEQLDSWVRSDSDVLLVAEQEAKVVGYALSHYHLPTKKATFDNLHVNPNYRGLGIGHNLTSELVKALRNQGAFYICTLVESDNNTIVRVLEKSGFKKGKTMIWMDIN